MSKIKKITAREILDSRGQPTIEAEIILTGGKKVWAGVPSGASTGSHEALELRDGDKKRFGGKGVLKAVSNINKKIAPKLIGLDPKNQKVIDGLMVKMDGTANKSKLGANAILAVSLAVSRAAALDAGLPLYGYLKRKYWSRGKWSFPRPMMNIMNGGAHANWAVDIQEFMIIPRQKNIKEAVRCGSEIFQSLKKILAGRGYPTTVGDEGGFAPKFAGNDRALAAIVMAVKKAGYILNRDVGLAIDAAASEFFRSDKYEMKADRKTRTADEMIKLYKKWLKKYRLESIEDGLAEDDWDGWRKLTAQLGKKTALVGDDLFVTNVARLKSGIKSRVANAVLIKLNQIGTVSETIDCIKLAQKHGYKVAVSHRSGETVDDFIADLAVASGAEYLKAGSLSRGERLAKYNRLMEIWDELKK